MEASGPQSHYTLDNDAKDSCSRAAARMKTIRWVIGTIIAAFALVFIFTTSGAGWIIFGLGAAVAALLISVYNRLVNLRQLAAQAWSDILVQLQQRHDLVPNLVNVVRAYAGHERGTLEAVVHARNVA